MFFWLFSYSVRIKLRIYLEWDNYSNMEGVLSVLVMKV